MSTVAESYTPARRLRDNPGKPGSWRVGPDGTNIHVAVRDDGFIHYAVAGYPTLHLDEKMRSWAAGAGEGLL